MSAQGMEVDEPPIRIGWPSTSAFLLGYLINTGLFGVLCGQIYTYYMAFPKDKLSIKLMVYGIFLLDVIQTVLATHDVFAIFAIGYGMISSLHDIHLIWLTVPILGGLAGCAGQLFFAYRIMLISESILIAGITAALSICTLSAAIYTGIQVYLAKELSVVFQDTRVYIACGVWNGSGALCDVLIVCVMTYYLSRKSTAFRSTNRVIAKLILMTIETGLVTATAAILCVIFLIGLRHTNLAPYFAVPGITISKLYSITFLAILNNRVRVYGGREPVPEVYDSVSCQWERHSGEDSV
ncbi:hypothetical protein AMATHDRAFT_66966 [Amanita thiersii Skay4041]|uniref:DUF6534 domain-containing protein n=1 Tax=Amanita thiersii Skay4041 TaxID=703135 RepID=A0A2A9NJ97_9AGAR|nr:hypothetical protein AMATHDRAFT_66966 [Amanita thiersii Skay4041]